MLSADTKLRLVHALTSQEVADEVERRLAVETPADATEAEESLALLDSALDSQIEERMKIALAGDADGAAGRELSKKIRLMIGVLRAVANGDEVAGTPAVAAEFSGQVAGMTTDVTITADNDGTAGNSILLQFDGLDDIDTVLAAWNLANPGNTASLTGDGSQIPDNGEEIQLAGGAAAVPDSDADTAPAKAAMGDEHMSASAKECLVHALASKAAADEFEQKFNAMVDAIQDA